MTVRKSMFGLEIIAVLLIKFIMLAALWTLFFAGNKPPADIDSIAGKIFGERHPVAPYKNQEYRK